MTIKAIETHYNGYCFRSRLEARWAVFFDAAGIRYEYEKEGYDLDGVRYLPDFWLPDLSCWYEIKPGLPSKEEQDACEALGDHTGNPQVICCGVPGSEELLIYCFDYKDSSAGMGWWEEPYWSLGHDRKPVFCSNDNCGSREFLTPGYEGWAGMKQIRDCLPHRESQAIFWPFYSAARSARFEHDEKLRRRRKHS
jgi:hypothetical protein